jgi:hypothetical protein
LDVVVHGNDHVDVIQDSVGHVERMQESLTYERAGEAFLASAYDVTDLPTLGDGVRRTREP